MTARYRFLPWVRLGAEPTIKDTLAGGLPAHASRSAKFRVNDGKELSVPTRLHGPGDVLSIDTQMVVRTDPPHLASEFEPNYFPLIEFDRPDVPWMFTPATGTDDGRLRPWLSLVVVRRQPGVHISVHPTGRRPVLRIEPPAQPGDELPDLSESWAWAHAQVSDTGTDATLDALLLNPDSPLNLSRLLCPRRLAPNMSYVACLVPAFDVGRKSGLGEPITPDDERELQPAWDSKPNPPREISLPVYYHWEFSTGEAGDFETLVRRLQRRPVPEGLGARPMSARDPGFGLPDPGDIALGGALRPAVSPPRSIQDPFETALQTLVNLPAARLDDSTVDPLVAPPIYGSLQAARRTIERTTNPRPWLDALNLDPRMRAVAGLGTLVIQDQQENLMTSAWEQLGQVGHQNRQMNQPAFAAAVLHRVHSRLAALEPEQLLLVSAPLHGRILVPMNAPPGEAEATVRTLRQQVRDSRTPTIITSAAFRKAVRGGGPLVRGGGRIPPSPHPPLQFLTHIASITTPIVTRLPRPDAVTPRMVNDQFKILTVNLLPNFFNRFAQLQAATTKMQDYFNRVAGVRRPPGNRNAIQPTFVRAALLAQLEPTRTVAAPISGPSGPDGAADELRPAQPGPSFPQPMYEALREFDPQLLLPGCDQVPPDSVVPLTSDPTFIEAFMVGLNHEMSRELLWREYPSDERSTSFQCFWAPANLDPQAAQQIPPVHEWTETSALGTHFLNGSTDNFVVLVRGELFNRYPGTTVYLTRSPQPGAPGSERVYPLFRGWLGPDMTFVGFGATLTQLRTEQWLVVFEQQPTEPRFGLDADTTTGRAPDDLTGWDDLTWGDIAADDHELSNLTHVPLTGRLHGKRIDPIQWGLNSGHMAAITLQRSFRIAVPLFDLVGT